MSRAWWPSLRHLAELPEPTRARTAAAVASEMAVPLLLVLEHAPPGADRNTLLTPLQIDLVRSRLAGTTH